VARRFQAKCKSIQIYPNPAKAGAKKIKEKGLDFLGFPSGLSP
jgi:hypothetical protein